jgi:hypothetical protein
MKQITLLGMVYLAALGAIAQPVVIDYTSYQSPVKNQGGRNTCSGFAVAACLETFAGVPADVSEQHIYAGLKMLEYIRWTKAVGSTCTPKHLAVMV